MAFEIENGILKKYTEEPGVTEITVPEGVTEIGRLAFCECNSLTQIILPEGVQSIHGDAFVYCARLKQVVIPESLQSIGTQEFRGCFRLAQIMVSENNPSYCSIDGILYTKDRKTLLCYPSGKNGSAILPENLQSIAVYAFADCSGLTQITLPEDLQSIGLYAFLRCDNLVQITLPEGLQSIGRGAFLCCKNLKVMKLHPDDPALYWGYNEVAGIENHITKALKMLRTRKYSMSLDPNIKYPFLILHYLHTRDADAGAFIKRNIAKIMTAAISNGSEEAVRILTATDRLISQQNIDKFIQQALDENQQRIWAYLADYKNRHFGFAPQDDSLL